MRRLFTWFDVENLVLTKKYDGSWPEYVSGISVYPDEIEMRIQDNTHKEDAFEELSQWFGPKYDREQKKIYMESLAGGGKRFLTVTIEIEPRNEETDLLSMKPDFASFSLYPEKPDLISPDLIAMEGPPSLWAFYSFKGGVSRTIHLISMAKALAEKHPERKILIVDADLEAPGLTWWAEKQSGNAEISFLDFLALAHYDKSENYSESIGITAERLGRQMLAFKTRKHNSEHYFLPAFREVHQLMHMPVRPEHVAWESGKEWIIPDLLRLLGRQLDVQAVIVDLRAGLSELSSPLLFDPRVNRVIVTTTSDQSVQGTRLILQQHDKMLRLWKDKAVYQNSIHPILIMSMIKEDLKYSDEMEKIRESFTELMLADDTEADDLFGKDTLIESMFDERLLYLKSLDSTLEKLEGTDMQTRMASLVEDRFPDICISKKDDGEAKKIDIKSQLEKLKDAAKEYEYAESGKSEKFLTTANLKKIAVKYEHTLPIAVLSGAKGSGKTHTWLQMSRLKTWEKFIQKVKKTNHGIKENNAFILPLISSANLMDSAKKIIKDCHNYAVETGKIEFKPVLSNEIEDRLAARKQDNSTDASVWRKFWINLMASSLSCEKDSANPLEAMQKMLSEKNSRIVFLIDGLEDIFQDAASDRVEEAAIRSLCQGVINNLEEWPDNRIGLLVFIRKDIVKSAIKQNFGQFEARFQSMEFKWNREEALRLVAWLVRIAAGLTDIVMIEGNVENASIESIEEALTGLWGLKLGKPESREAYTANWIVSALSDFNGQLMARDVVRLIGFAAENAINSSSYPNRLLPPSAVKNALDPCGREKIAEIKQEIHLLKDIFTRFKNIPDQDRQIPFSREDMSLKADEIEALIGLGMITEYKGMYYMPEIIRRGLGFKLSGGSRPKVVTLLRRVLKNV